VKNRIWERASMEKGFLCIGCLEQRIGRELMPNDFTSVPINEPCDWDTPRLLDRKGWTKANPKLLSEDERFEVAALR
jgi:hypothetical protein